jgi:DNA-binding transcriptional ArsR family regulator
MAESPTTAWRGWMHETPDGTEATEGGGSETSPAEDLMSYKPLRPDAIRFGDAVICLGQLMPARQAPKPSSPPPGPAGVHVRSDPVYVAKAQLFRVLGHPVRIRILELLVNGERTVGDLQAELELDSSGTSQHLAALRQLGVLESRRAGTSTYYSIKDPRVSQLLAVAKQILTSALSDSQALLSDLVEQPAAHRQRG